MSSKIAHGWFRTTFQFPSRCFDPLPNVEGGNGHDLIEIDEVDKRSDNFVNNYHSSNPKYLVSDILENEHNSDSALEKACNTSDANKLAQYKKTMEQQITELISTVSWDEYKTWVHYR